MPDRMTTEGRIEYWYQVFGALTVLFIEVKLKSAPRLSAWTRPIREITHGILLREYMAGLKAYHDRSVVEATEGGNPNLLSSTSPAWLTAQMCNRITRERAKRR